MFARSVKTMSSSSALARACAQAHASQTAPIASSLKQSLRSGAPIIINRAYQRQAAAPSVTSSAVPSSSRKLAQLATAAPTSSTDAANAFANQAIDPSALTMEQHEELLLDVIAGHSQSAEFKARECVRVIRAPLMLAEEHLETSLTYSTLCGEGKMACRPIIFLDEQAGALLGYYHMGRRLAGHQGIVHGGFQAMLLDECMARATFPRLPAKISVTANLKVDYKAPLPVNRYIVLKAETVKVEGRKAWVEGSVSDAHTGEVYASASGLFIQPKWADKMAPIR
ncbi:mitochondrial protein [Ceratocystis lukuohia]|uniref:Thioesterase domain-containing protein n=3 Tax=Ceratocystis TaxID=5157 RepID=A0A0F8CRD2_CERFI|nr:putative protein mitochondrial [Ceratocystis platani]PHH49086.1 mitochondrial protein [Ceratocystis fimbriata CBS 114723]